MSIESHQTRRCQDSTDRIEIFFGGYQCNALYLTDRNGKQAAIRAGYSPRSAEAQSSVLLRYPKVKAAVASLGQEQAECLDILAEDVLRQVYRMAFVDSRHLVDTHGRPIPLQLLPDVIASAIQAVEIIQTPAGNTYKYKLADRNSAAGKLMRHLGLFEKDHRQSADSIATLLAAVHGTGSRLPTTS